MAAGSHKQEAFAVLEVLKKHTDENHRIRQQQIIDLVEQETGQVYVRKSIRKNLEDLIKAGYPIHFGKGWYYEHELCPAELDLIIDSLRTTAGITAAQRDELIRKVSRLGGSWYAKNDSNDQLRPVNPQFLYTLDTLHEAIAKKMKVVFCYGDYGVDKKLHSRCAEDGSPKEYLINPYRVLTVNGRYYLICNVDKYDNAAHFRIERITDIRITDQPLKPMEQVADFAKGIDAQRYVNDHPYMYQGKARKHVLRLKPEAVNDVLDWFGMETKLKAESENVLLATVRSDDVSLKYWCQRYEEHLIKEDAEAESAGEETAADDMSSESAAELTFEAADTGAEEMTTAEAAETEAAAAVEFVPDETEPDV